MNWKLIFATPFVLTFLLLGAMFFQYVSSGEADAKRDNSVLQVVEQRRKPSDPKRPERVSGDEAQVNSD